MISELYVYLNALEILKNLNIRLDCDNTSTTSIIIKYYTTTSIQQQDMYLVFIQY